MPTKLSKCMVTRCVHDLQVERRRVEEKEEVAEAGEKRKRRFPPTSETTELRMVASRARQARRKR